MSSVDARTARQFLVVTTHAVRDRLPLAGVVAVILAGLSVLSGSLWPSLQDTFTDLPPSLRDTLATVLAGSDLTTPVGWMNAEVMSVSAPIGVIAVAVISIVRAVAGEEEDQTVGLLLSAPLSRTTFLLAKATATVGHVLVAVAGLALGLVVGSWVGDLGLSTIGIVGACVHAGLLGLFFGGVAAVASAATGARRLSSAIAAAAAVVAFAVNAFVPLVDFGALPLVDSAGLARLSPWYYSTSSNPLANGPDPLDVAVLATGTALLLVVAVVALRRRDLRG